MRIPKTPTKILEPVDLRFMPVPGSKFVMGSSEDDVFARSDEFPQHEVVLTTFYIMEREVTNGEYQRCMDSGACTPPLVEEEGPTSLFNDPEYANYPVVGVDWYQAQTYCEFIDARLPT